MRITRRHLVAAAGLAAMPVAGARAQAKPINITTIRTPSYEFYTQKATTILPGVRVEPTIMQVDKMLELFAIQQSSKSDGFDVVWTSDAVYAGHAKKGWLEPLDDLWEKYKDEYNFADFPKSVVDGFRYEGKLYAIPTLTNTELLFYRTDLLAEKGLEVPKTWADYRAAAMALHTPRRSGIAMKLKPVDAAMNTLHYFLNQHGDGWFDAKWRPTFNSAKGVAAIEALRDIGKFAAPGFTAQANDENTVLMQQDLAAMQVMWVSRAAQMNNPERSKVVGKIGFAIAPGGGQRIGYDGFAIAKNSKADRDTMFRLMAATTSASVVREGSAVIVPARNSLLSDPELVSRYNFFPVVQEGLRTGKVLPNLPEFSETAEITTRYMNQAIVGQVPTKQALDTAAAEVTEFLKKRGYDL
ncbi:MAG: extracellular solute-binding protein [Acetobacteraceae bacterium]|nr:extracellular solute-binding protein [Acetobacteraceae bacterium]